MTEYERDQIAAWLSDPENTKSLSAQDQIKIAMANIEFMEKNRTDCEKGNIQGKGSNIFI